MLTSTVRSWLRPTPALGHETLAATRRPAPIKRPVPLAQPEVARTDRPETRSVWPAARLALTNQLWGSGFILPGGEKEILRLARPLGTSAAANLLIVGVGAGGPASAVASNLGTCVTGTDNDPSLLAAARGLITRSQLTKKVSIRAWDPANPDFGRKSHHHCLALQPFNGAQPEPILDCLAQALRPGGQMVVTDLTAPDPLDARDPTIRRWAELENRNPATLLAPIAVTRMLGRVGLDVRVAEDMSQRHLEHAMAGWRAMLHNLRGDKPTRQEASQLLREAELWMLRRRLLRAGKLQMMRWNAISRVSVF